MSDDGGSALGRSDFTPAIALAGCHRGKGRPIARGAVGADRDPTRGSSSRSATGQARGQRRSSRRSPRTASSKSARLPAPEHVATSIATAGCRRGTYQHGDDGGNGQPSADAAAKGAIGGRSGSRDRRPRHCLLDRPPHIAPNRWLDWPRERQPPDNAARALSSAVVASKKRCVRSAISRIVRSRSPARRASLIDGSGILA